MREIRMLRTTWRELETELGDELRHRQMAKAAGNSYSPCLRPPRHLSTLRNGRRGETDPKGTALCADPLRFDPVFPCSLTPAPFTQFLISSLMSPLLVGIAILVYSHRDGA